MCRNTAGSVAGHWRVGPKGVGVTVSFVFVFLGRVFVGLCRVGLCIFVFGLDPYLG